MVAAAAALGQAPDGPPLPPASGQSLAAVSGRTGSLPSQPVLYTSFRGRVLSYVTVDGMAVHAGDMVLGRIEDLEPEPPLAESAKSVDQPPRSRRDLSPRQDKLWPEGIVPYLIDTDISDEQRQNIEEAIRTWNEETVLSLVARSTEPNFVRFSNVASGYCRSRIGMVGGEQQISIPPTGCTVNTFAHEIGHAVGLWHEHQREDRDDFVTVLAENVQPHRWGEMGAKHPALGPYDYASVMHYSPRGVAWNRGEVFETIPPGMSIPSAGLSAGDIDGVARLYGKPLEATSISTNPPGLQIVVDGVRVTAPASFDWGDGSAHVVEVPVSQTIEGTRYLFGRWNDGGSRLRNVTAGKDSTWLEANFIVQHRVRTRVEPTDSGTVALRPESPDGYYTLRTPIQAVATAAPGTTRRFRKWRGILYGHYGRSTNPAIWRVDKAGKEFAAQFTDRPVLRIEANVDPFVLHLRNYFDGEDEGWTYGPFHLLTDRARNEIGIGIDEVRKAPRSSLQRYRFDSWSDGGVRSRTFSLPPDGGSLSAMVISEFPLSTAVANPDSGTITVDPASPDSFYRDGESVRLAAIPSPGWEFVQWLGDLDSRESSATIAMNRPTHVQAIFSQTSEVRPSEPVRVSLPATPDYGCFIHRSGSAYRVEPPSDASEIRITYESTTPGVEVDLYVRAGAENLSWKNHSCDATPPIIGADYQSTQPGGTESIVINADSNPPLDPSETYYAFLVVFSPRTRIKGTISTEIESGPSSRPSVGASPRALTFVSPRNANPAAQIVRLTNNGTAPFRYAVRSDRFWLSATPVDGTLGAGSTTEISVGALTFFAWPDSHHGLLTISAAAPNSQVSEAVAAIPVAFVVVPPNTVGAAAATPSVESVHNRPSWTPGAATSAKLVFVGNDMALGVASAEKAARKGSALLPTVLRGASVIGH